MDDEINRHFSSKAVRSKNGMIKYLVENRMTLDEVNLHDRCNLYVTTGHK